MEISNKKRVAVIAGARSTEHEVSLVSAYNIVKVIDRNKYEVFVIGISKDGIWKCYDPDNFVVDPESVGTAKLSETALSGRLAVTQCSNKFYDIDNGGHVVFECDVVFPAVLGNYAEDGTIQGLLRMMDVPFATPDVLGSAVGMDKDVSYRLMQAGGVDVANFAMVRKGDVVPDYRNFVSKLGATTLFVKPANAGSSVGVSKVTSQPELDKAIEYAFQYDVKVIIQQGIVGREIEIAVMGNIGSQVTSVIGEIAQNSSDDFYSYSNKYINDKSTLIAPAPASPELYKRIQETAVKVMELLECEGFARVDFFVDKDEKVYCTEINTMPGFTSISMFPRLWSLSGVSYPELVDRLLALAIERHEYRIAPMILDADDVLAIAKDMGQVG
jgi:D-alanine-D-alanine ligase